MTGGVRDTLAAAACDLIPEREDEDCPCDDLTDAVLAALSSPEVVRVATEALVGHQGAREYVVAHTSGRRWVAKCYGCEWRSEPFQDSDDMYEIHAAHQWSVLVSALRGER